MTTNIKPFNAVSDLKAVRASVKEIQLAAPLLLELLLKHKDRVGRVVMGQLACEWTADELSRTVRIIHDEISDHKLRYGVLRLFRKICLYWASVQRSSVRLPPIPILRKPPKNPNRLSIARCRKRYDDWKRTLAALVGNVARNPESRVFGMEAVIISSVLHSGLLDLNYLVALVRAFASFEQRTILAGGRLHIELEVARRGNPRGQFLRLQPDLLTSVLWLVTPTDAASGLLRPNEDGVPPTDKEIKTRIRQLFASISVSGSAAGNQNCGLVSLLEAVEVIAHSEMPGVVVNIANGANASNSIPRSDLERMVNGDAQYLSMSRESIVRDTPFEDEAQANFRYSPDEAGDEGESELSDLFQEGERSTVRQRLVVRSRSRQDLVARLCDFGDYLLAVRTGKNKMRSIETVRSYALALYGCAYWYFGSTDPAEPEPEGLEAAYSDIIAGLPGDERIEAARLLRLFHTYLHAQGKPWLALDSVLRRYWPTSSVDTGVIFEEDYLAIIEDINVRWRRDQPRRSEMAQVIVDLFHEGMRHEEARQRVINDVFVDKEQMPLEVIVRKTRDRLKTLASKRRVPVEHTATEQSRLRLSRWRLKRLGEPGTIGSDFLFSENGEMVPDSLIDEINETYIRPRTGHHAHSFRHALASFAVLGGTLGDMFGHDDFPDSFPGRNSFPQIFPGHEQTNAAIEGWGRNIRRIYGHNQESGKHVHMIARILGHSPKTLMSVYFNLPATLLRICLEYSQTMQPDERLVRKASLRKRTTLQGWTEVRGIRDIPVHLFRARLRKAGEPVLPNGDGPKSTARLSDDWTSKWSSYLMEREISGRAPEEVARRNNLSFEHAESRYERSAYLRGLRSGPGYRTRVEETLSDSGTARRLACPRRPTHEKDLEVVRRVAQVIEELVNSRERWALTKRALDTFVHRIWHERNWVVFHTIEEAGEARSYLNWLRLCFLKKDVRFGSFSQKERSRCRKAWRDELLTDNDNVEDIAPPNRESEATEWWFGIAPKFETDESGDATFDGSAGFRYVMTMAYIVFGDTDSASGV